MDRKVKNSVNMKGHSAIARFSMSSALTNDAIIPNSYVISTAATSVPEHMLPTKVAANFCPPQMPQHQHGTRQRSSLVALQQEQLQLVKNSPKTKVTSTAQRQSISQANAVQKNQNGHNTTNLNSNHNQTVTAAKAAAASVCIASPMEQLAAVQAKATSIRNKNEEAINDLRTRIPEIENIFDIHSRIGNGTFSTVLLGTLKKEHDLPEVQRRKFAIKHHIPTSHPDRIMKELQCMAKIGGTDNVVGINCCIRYNESVAFIMPYLAHDRFHDFYSRMDVPEVQYYMKNLLIALRHVHRFNVIHRDVKPSNFLYNRRKRQFLLVDFGLAQQMSTSYMNLSAVGGKLINPALAGPIGQLDGKRSREQDDSHVKKSGEGCESAVAVTGTGEVVSGVGKRLKCTEPDQQMEIGPNTRTNAVNNGILTNSPFKMPLKQINVIPNTPIGLKSTLTQPAAGSGSGVVGVTHGGGSNTSINELVTGAPARKSGGGGVGSVPIVGASALSNRLQQKLRAQGAADVSSHRSSSVGGVGGNNKNAAAPGSNGNSNAVDAKYNTNRNISNINGPKCYCYGNPQVCNICLVKKEIHASRAGTPGYRPPEVLLKYPDQTTSVDVWAAGVIFLSVLSSVYPFFKAPNDYVALAEMVTIFGDKTIRKTAFLLDRLVTLSQKTKPLDLRKLCVRFRNRAKFSSPELLKKYQRPDGSCDVCKNCDQFYFNCLCMESGFVTEPVDADDIFPASAYDLLYRLLEVNPHKRITADEALKHEFFQDCQNNNNLTTSTTRTPSKNATPPTLSLSAAAGDSLKKTRD